MLGSHFRSPEALAGENERPLTVQSDIWSLGCTLLEIVTGLPPWSGIQLEVLRSKVLKLRQSAMQNRSAKQKSARYMYA